MSLSRVVVSRAALPGGGLDRLAEFAEVVRPGHGDRTEPSELQRPASGAAALLCLGNDTMDAALLDAAGSSLRVVSLASMGFDAWIPRLLTSAGLS